MVVVKSNRRQKLVFFLLLGCWDMDLGVSDEMLGTFVPIVVYWIYSGIYVVLGLFAENYRLHSKQEEDEKNLVSKGAVVKGVLLQQLVQAVVATLLFAVSFLRCDKFLRGLVFFFMLNFISE